MGSLEVVPAHTQILVIGGGPGGTYAAMHLAREGFQVTVLESTKFPRYHVGESMVPSCRFFLKLVDLDETVMAHGFCRKPGAAFKLSGEKREAYTDFVAAGEEHSAWNVVRSEFDHILLKHSIVSGVHVVQETKVTSINFSSPTGLGRPISANWQSVTDLSVSGTIRFDYLIDASGRAGLMEQKYLKNRHFNSSLRNIASWGYWSGCERYAVGTKRHNAAWFEALSDQSGWNWFIPLHNGMTSIGVVMNQDMSNARKKAFGIFQGGTTPITAKDHYLECLKLSPGIVDLIGENGKLIDEGPYAEIRQASDYSYSATKYSGDHFRIIGDAAAFIDPFFSSGVHLAFTGALSAAASIASSIKGGVTEQEACAYHDEKIGIGYTRFLVIVLSAYKQMKAQQTAVLNDINEDNFDRAFQLIRPIIQGHADVGKKRYTEDDLQKTLEFCSGVFEPVNADMRDSVLARVDAAALAPDAPAVLPEVLQKLAPADKEAQQVLKELNARKGLGADGRGFGSPESWNEEVCGGFVLKTEKGSLGLVKA